MVSPPPRPKRKLPPGSNKKASERRPSTTNCATGSSAASVIGASRFPIVWKKDAAGNLYHEALPESVLPLLPPTLEDYKPTSSGEPPLARAKDWLHLPDGSTRETNTMPQWAGSCWYYLRYLDAKNSNVFVGKEAEYYWMGEESYRLKNANSKPTPIRPSTKSLAPGVDLYVGGTEHAVLHLLYARFWHKVLFDLGHVSTAEPFYKLVNQGLILGEMEFTQFAFPNGQLVSAEKIRDITEEATPAGPQLIGFHKETGEKVLASALSRTPWKSNPPARFCAPTRKSLWMAAAARCPSRAATW